MSQSRRHSLIEVCTSTTIGFIGCWIINFFIFKYSPLSVPWNATLCTGACTVYSFARGYAIRRHFATRFTNKLPNIDPRKLSI